MGRSLREVMSSKSENGLMDYLTNFNKYTPDSIAAAVDELKRRGKNFTDEELSDIKSNIETRKKAESEDDELFVTKSWKDEGVTDPTAPLLYSKATIRFFSTFFCVIFGAVLLANNINDSKKKWIVIGFGTVYTALTIFLLNLIPSNMQIRFLYLTALINAGGGLGLTTTFWDKFVGKELKYRAKPPWIPLIISFVITTPIVLAIIYG
jgi:hypothetical protein